MIQNFINFPEMKTGIELKNALSVLPTYSSNIRNQSKSERLIALSDLYTIYIPSAMSEEIYSKLYLALLRSMQKSLPSFRFIKGMKITR